MNLISLSFSKLFCLMKCPKVFFLSLLILSMLSLGLALIAEIWFNLLPCLLCQYQRIPFILVIAFASLGYALCSKQKCSQAPTFLKEKIEEKKCTAPSTPHPAPSMNSSSKYKTTSIPILFLVICCGTAFLCNALLGFYHSGIERKWWPSFLEGCSIPSLGNDPEAILETIMNAPAVRCDEMPWVDPLLGLSMANYNTALSLLLSIFCFGSFLLLMKRRSKN